MNYSIRSFNGKKPVIHEKAIIGDNVVIIGDVIIEENVNIWPNTTIRGDMAQIHIKKNTNIQDNSVIHVDYDTPCIVGENCIIGHRALLHSAIINDYCLVGMGSIVLDNAKMESYSMLGAGSMLTSNKTIISKQLWISSPAKYFRDISDIEIKHGLLAIDHYINMAKGIFDN